LVLAPVARSDYRAVMAKLESRLRTLKTAAPNLVAQRKPLEILQRLRLPLPIALPDVSNPADAEWARLANLPTLWYVRRRNLAYRDDLVGNGVAATGRDEIALEDAVRARITSLALTTQFNAVLAKTTTKAAWSVMSLLALPRLVDSPALTAAALGALSAKAAASTTGRLDNADVLAVGVDLNTPGVGDGLVMLERSSISGVTKSSLASLASNDAWRTLDASAVVTPSAQISKLAARLAPLPAIKTESVVPVQAAARPAAKLAMAATADKPHAKPHPAVVASKPVSPAKSSKLAAAAKKAAAKSGGAKKPAGKKPAK
jgi:hypothetical protein